MIAGPLAYSRGIGRIWRVAEALEYGIVGISEGIISTEIAPFVGMKESGIGREGQNTASRNSSKSNICAWAASAGKDLSRARRGRFSPPLSAVPKLIAMARATILRQRGRYGMKHIIPIKLPKLHHIVATLESD